MGTATQPYRSRDKRAITLKGLDARTVISANLPRVLPIMTEAQIQQVQKVLDAAVINPEIEKEGNRLWDRSVTSQIGTQVNRDERIVRQANRIFQTKIFIDERDKRVRLSFEKLLAPGALSPQTDNPDEAAYLKKIHSALVSKGVWLWVTNKWYRDPSDYSHTIMNDPRSFEVWLTYGYNGRTIDAPGGLLTRDALISGVWVGNGYYTEVYEGTYQKALSTAIKALRNRISTGETLHEMQVKARDDAKPGVVWVSDKLGGANFPSQKIWDLPNKLVVRALEQNVGGNIKASSKTLLYAAIVTEISMKKLEGYIRDTVDGAATAVKVLEVAVFVGHIAEAALLIYSVAAGLTRLMAMRGGSTKLLSAGEGKLLPPAAEPPPPSHAPVAYQKTHFAGYEAAEARTLKLGTTMHTDAGIGTAFDSMDLATQQRITGWVSDFEKAAKELMVKKGDNLGGWVVSREEFDAIDKTVSAKWGEIWSLFP